MSGFDEKAEVAKFKEDDKVLYMDKNVLSQMYIIYPEIKNNHINTVQIVVLSTDLNLINMENL